MAQAGQGVTLAHAWAATAATVRQPAQDAHGGIFSFLDQPLVS